VVASVAENVRDERPEGKKKKSLQEVQSEEKRALSFHL